MEQQQISAKKQKAMEKVKRANATTYVANLHFKEQGQTFAQKLKRVLKAEFSA